MKRILTIILAGALLVACPGADDGDSGDEASEEGEAAENAESSEEESSDDESESPEEESEAGDEDDGDEVAAEGALGGRELGDQVFQRYNEALRELATTLEGFPDPATARPQVEALKAEIISDMVALGRQRENLSEAEQREFSMGLSIGMMNNPDQEAWDAYNEAFEHYNEVDSDFAQVLSSFNIITQYSQFDLLREQEPEEADRLGLP